MDKSKKISIRFKEEEISKIEKNAGEENLCISEYIRKKVLTERKASGKQKTASKENIKVNLLYIQKNLDEIKRYSKKLNFDSIEDAMEEIFNELL